MAADRPPTSRNRRLLMLNMVGYSLVNYRPRAGQYPRYGYRKIRGLPRASGTRHAGSATASGCSTRSVCTSSWASRRSGASACCRAGPAPALSGGPRCAGSGADQRISASRGEARSRVWRGPMAEALSTSFSPSESHKTRPRRSHRRSRHDARDDQIARERDRLGDVAELNEPVSCTRRLRHGAGHCPIPV